MNEEQTSRYSLFEGSTCFNEFLAGTIREALVEAMSETTTEALSYHLQKTCPSLYFDSRFDPLLFDHTLISLFGPGTSFIENIILAKIAQCLQIRIEDLSRDLVSSLEEIKVAYMSRSRSHDLQNRMSSCSVTRPRFRLRATATTSCLSGTPSAKRWPKSTAMTRRSSVRCATSLTANMCILHLRYLKSPSWD